MKVDHSKIVSRRYHHKVFFPQNLPNMILAFFESFDEIFYTRHAEQEMANDQYGNIPKPSKSDLMKETNLLIEAYEPLIKDEPSGYLQKVLIRTRHLSNTFDYCYLISREGVIVSSWVSKKKDHHRLTHSLRAYWCPEEIKEKRYESIEDQQKTFKEKKNARLNITTN